MGQDASKAQRIYRVDRFTVPDGARAEFLDKVRQTHELLRVQPGFLQDMVLEQPSMPGEHNVITIVEWESEAAIASAKAKVQSMHAQANFNPQELIARLGIKADIASYRHI
ncbi:antibiotic biosynthesis monooxygenase family protein [Aminobacter niigataensis]|uniref:Heme-degrading monooxygenase HmoA n=1 Tax=Aminobacter niigataensis TaxID=83265 RepID=A0ABR6L0I7_9HYPH|nr:antibiotic biosynthesis monooxygenase family protein [Aminobacter niigataensis]MBB4650260.1 heme-degrading monooxygenase HmoA [Aminobacter niigataensis]CAI2933059.1 Antibiotic biosynthesis monooxygenase [Aminobacter niigataensis]